MGIIISKLSAVSTCSSFMCVTHLVKGAQFLNATLVFATIPATFILLSQEYMHLSNHKDLV